MRPTKRHFLETSAALAHAAETDQLADCSEYEKMLHLLARCKKQLKEIQSVEQKESRKKEMLADFMPWITGALQTANGKQDDVLMTWQVWTIDAGEYQLALDIAEYALHQDLVLPDVYSRTLATTLAEEFADRAKAARNLNAPFALDYLQRIAALTDDKDMPDQSRARLYREIGELQKDSQLEQALASLERALALDDKIGVTGEIKKLRKQLGKAEPKPEQEPAKQPEPTAEPQTPADTGE